MAVSLWGDFDASRLRGLAKKAKDGPQARRCWVSIRRAPRTALLSGSEANSGGGLQVRQLPVPGQ